MKNTNATRYIPQGYVEIKNTPLMQVYQMPNMPIAMVYIGKRSKPQEHTRFSSVQRMDEKLIEMEGRLLSWEKMKEERKAKRKGEMVVEVGQILYNSWGYEQTNIDFYQVVEVKGSQFVIQEIAGRRVEGSLMSHGMADEVVPVKDKFVSDEKITKRSFSMECGYLSKTEVGKSHYRSWYA